LVSATQLGIKRVTRVSNFTQRTNLPQIDQRRLAEASLPIFQAGNGNPLDLDNLANRVIKPALFRCEICGKPEDEHKPEGLEFKRDNSLPRWHDWHAFRRGLATNLHETRNARQRDSGNPSPQ